MEEKEEWKERNSRVSLGNNKAPLLDTSARVESKHIQRHPKKEESAPGDDRGPAQDKK